MAPQGRMESMVMDVSDVEGPPTPTIVASSDASRFAPISPVTDNTRRKGSERDSRRPCQPHNSQRNTGAFMKKEKQGSSRRLLSSSVENQRVVLASASLASTNTPAALVTPSRSSCNPVAKPGSVSPKSVLSPSLLLPHNNFLAPTPPHRHIVYLIRHGESKGQMATSAQRRTDSTLIDCGLTQRGQQQAMSMMEHYHLPCMDMVLSSPLTRALQTAVLGFPTAPRIVVHYDLRELGGKGTIPENQPRPWSQVFADLPPGSQDRIDTQSLAKQNGSSWPYRHDASPNVLRRTYIQDVFRWLAATTHHQHCERPQHIAVVCHFHVIRAALTNPKGFCDPQLKPENAAPLPCYLTPEGRLIPC